MKSVSPSKAIGTLASLAAILTIAGASVYQSQKAQAQTATQTRISDASQVNPACEGVNLSFPEEFIDETADSCSTFGQFSGIDLTPEQEEVYRRASERLSERSKLQEGEIKTEVIPDGGIQAFPRSADGYITHEAGDAAVAASIDDIPNAEQIDELNARFPEAEFALNRQMRLTPEQITEIIEMEREYEDAMLAAFTPEQQRIYLRNLAVQYWIKASDTDLSDG